MRGGSASATFDLDSARGSMRYQVRVSGLAPEHVFAAVLSREAPDRTRRVIQRLSQPESIRASGTVWLTPDERADLFAGRISLILFSTADKLGSSPAVLMRHLTRVVVRAPGSPSALR